MSLLRSENILWTNHSLRKLRQYNLSASRIMRILRHPSRKEVGIAPETIASMQQSGSKKHPYEIWVMHTREGVPRAESRGNKLKKIMIISAWRYPGVSPIGEPPPIPDEVWEILNKEKVV